MKPDAFITALKKEIPVLTVCTGDERFFMEEVYLALEKRLTGEDPGLQVIHWESQAGEKEEPEAHRLVAEMCTPGLFSPRKLIHCRDGGRLLKKAAKILAPLAEPGGAPNNLCIFADKLDGRTALAKSLKGSHSLVECQALRAQASFYRGGGDLSPVGRWTQKRARGKGLKIDADAVEFFVSLTGNNLFLIDSELQKLTLCEKEEIDVADIESLTGMSALHTPFDLWEKIETGNLSGALGTLKVILRNGLMSADGKLVTETRGIGAILFAIFRNQVRNAAAVKTLESLGREQAEIQAATGVRHPFAYKKAREYGARLTAPKYNAMFQAILGAERKIKRQGLTPVPVIEETVVRLANANSRKR